MYTLLSVLLNIFTVVASTVKPCYPVPAYIIIALNLVYIEFMSTNKNPTSDL